MCKVVPNDTDWSIFEGARRNPNQRDGNASDVLIAFSYELSDVKDFFSEKEYFEN